jgi:hypothetical protein
VSACPAAHHTTGPDGNVTAAGAEALSGPGGAGATAAAERHPSPAVEPEGAHAGQEGAQAATPAPRATAPPRPVSGVAAGAMGGGGGSRRAAPAAERCGGVEPPDDSRRRDPGERATEEQSAPGECGLVILSAGVDSLYASAVGAPASCHLATAQERKAAAAAEEQPVVWEPEGAGRAFLVRPHGWRGFPIWLTSPAMDVCMGGGKALPALYLWLQAAFLHQVGVEVAVEDAERVRAALVSEREPQPDPDGDWPRPEEWPGERGQAAVAPALGGELTASRIDLYADTQGWQPVREDFPRFVCRAQRKWEFEADRQMHTRGRRLSGFTFGRGAVLARIYDKTLELAVRGETWPEVIWRGADPERPVWRVEVQFRRQALKAFGLRTVADVLAVRQELWDYGMRWLSLREPNGDTNRSRWPEAPVWRVLREAAMGSPRSELVRERREAASRLRLLRGFVGYATSLAACGDDDDLEEALREVVPEVQAYLARRGTTFDDVVTVKREQRVAL